jgi:hypothetical protein
MRIPAVKLIDLLAPDRVYALRSANYTGMDEALPYTHAIAMAVRGEVEGIATASQRIKFLRVLPESERPASTVAQEIDKSRSTAFARTNLGVFRQPVREVVMHETVHGHRYAVAAGDIVGHVYTHCGARA